MNIKLYYSALLTIFILSGCAADNGLIYSPDMAIFYKTRGESYYAEENYDLALADYNKAIEIYPRLVSAYILRARIYKEQENYDFALADYNRAAKINPNIYYVYLNRAEIYQQKKEYDFALADYTKAIELNPSPNYYRGRGSVYYMKKQYDSAVKEYTKAIKLNNYYAPAYNDLAWLLATCSDEKYRFESHLSDEISQINCDPDKLKQVFINIILNGTEAMPSGGVISIKTKKNNGGVEISISDEGRGMSNEELKDIFEPFYTTREKGTGLGLAISYKIVQAHNGDIWAVSEPGKGTTFIIQIPDL